MSTSPFQTSTAPSRASCRLVLNLTISGDAFASRRLPAYVRTFDGRSEIPTSFNQFMHERCNDRNMVGYLAKRFVIGH